MRYLNHIKINWKVAFKSNNLKDFFDNFIHGLNFKKHFHDEVGNIYYH